MPELPPLTTMLASIPLIHAVRRMIPSAKAAMFLPNNIPARIPIVAAALAAVFCSEVRAADAEWARNGGGSWTNPTYWSPNTGSAPGSTNGTNSTDVATFGDAITTKGVDITVDANRNIFGIVFTNTLFNYTNSGGSLLFSSGGYVNFTGSGTGITNTISSTITNLGAGASFTNNSTSGTLVVSGNVYGSASFINNSTSGLMTISGAVAGTAAAGQVSTLTIGGNNTTATNQLGSGQITDGVNGGKLGLVKTGDSIWWLSRNSTPQNTFSGGTDVQQGTLILQIGAGVGTGTLTLGGLSGSGNALLDMSGASVGTISNSIVARSGSTGTATIQHTNTGVRSLTGVMTLNRDLTLSATSATGQYSLSGGMMGSGNLIKTGAGILYLNIGTARGGTGGIVINEGTALMANAPSMSENMRLSVASGTTFTYSTAGASVAGLDGAGTVVQNAATTARNLRLGGTGNYSFSGSLTNINTGLMGLIVDLKEGGSQVFSGVNYHDGDTRMRSGTLALDYSTSSASKLSDSKILYLNGGTLELRGGSTTETVGSTTVAGGAQANITRSSGSTVLALNAISTGTSGGLNIAAANIATTTSANTNGLIGGSGRITIGGADWAANDGSGNIIAYTGYTAYTDNNAGSTTTNYSVSGNASSTNNVNAQTLKITTTGAGQSLNLGTKALTLGNGSGQSAGLLFVGADDYTITAGALGASGGGNAQAIHNYGAGKLTLASPLSHPISFFGTGYTVLAGNSTANVGISVGSGTVEFSSNAQIGSPTGTGQVTIWGGRLVANTAGGNITLTNGAGGASWRQVNIGGDNAVLDVIGGNSLIVGGQLYYADNVGGVNPLTIGSASSSGKIVFSGNNANWNGDLNLAGATLSVSADNNLGNTNNWVEFTGSGILETTASFGTSRFIVTRSGNTGAFAPASGTTLTLSNYIQGAGGLKVDGAGTLELQSALNSYTGTTTVQQGTLKLSGSGQLPATAVIQNSGTFDIASLTDSSTTIGSLAGSGAVSLGAKTLQMGNATSTSISGVISGTGGGITKQGSGTLTLSGAAANIYTGATTVSAGVLELAGTSGSAAGSSASVSVASGAKLLISQSNQVNDSASVTLSGGTITRGSGASETFGALTLTANSYLDFGGIEQSNKIQFGTLTLGSYKFNVSNFKNLNQLAFTATSLENGQSILASSFTFAGSSDYTSSFAGSTFTITGISAIPEPSTVIAAIGLAGLMLWPSRRRIIKETSKILGLRRRS